MATTTEPRDVVKLAVEEDMSMCRSISVHEGLLFFKDFCATMDSLEPTIKSAYEVIKKFAKAEEQQGLQMKPIGDDPTQPPYQLSQWRFRVAYRLFTAMVDTIRAKDTIREMSWDIAFNFTNQKYFFEQALSLMILEKNPEIPEDIFKTPSHLQRMESLLFAGYYNLLDTTFDEEHGISCVRIEYMMELVRMVEEGKGDRISVLKKLKFAYDEFKTSLRNKPKIEKVLKHILFRINERTIIQNLIVQSQSPAQRTEMEATVQAALKLFGRACDLLQVHLTRRYGDSQINLKAYDWINLDHYCPEWYHDPDTKKRRFPHICTLDHRLKCLLNTGPSTNADLANVDYGPAAMLPPGHLSSPSGEKATRRSSEKAYVIHDDREERALHMVQDEPSKSKYKEKEQRDGSESEEEEEHGLDDGEGEEDDEDDPLHQHTMPESEAAMFIKQQIAQSTADQRVELPGVFNLQNFYKNQKKGKKKSKDKSSQDGKKKAKKKSRPSREPDLSSEDSISVEEQHVAARESAQMHVSNNTEWIGCCC